MLIQEVETDLPPGEVIDRARTFFSTRFSPYTGFVEDASDSHIRFRFDAGSLVLGTGRKDGRTWVRGSTSRLHHELSQFLTTLAFPEDVRQNALGPGSSGSG